MSGLGDTVEMFLQALAAGLLVGAVYGLMCVGLGIIFGVMRVINFAQGDFLMLGMYFTLYLVTSLGVFSFLGPSAAPFAGALVAGPVLFIGAYLLHRFLISRVTGIQAAIVGRSGFCAGVARAVNNSFHDRKLAACAMRSSSSFGV